MVEKKISLKLRLGTMLFDHFIMCAIFVPPLILISIIVNSKPFQTEPIETLAFYLMIFCYLNKDFFNGRSISKRILGLKVIDRKTGQTASNLKCYIRNMTIPIWPLEVLVSVFSPYRRIGDLIANTKLEITEKEKGTTILSEFKSFRLTQITYLTIAVGIIYTVILWLLMKSFLNR